MRASDAERERALEELRVHASEGRLDLDELEQRMDAVLDARTREDLDAPFADLPRERRPRTPLMQRSGFRSHLFVYLAVNAGLVAIWALSGMGYFWPVWPLAGWGVGLLADAGAFGSCGTKGKTSTARSSHGGSAGSSTV
jgi:Domain of unknown function (DUF1707)/2TM domain